MKKCTLVIKDEVNIQFVGVDPVTRRKLIDSVKFKLPYAHNLPAVRLGRWDGTVAYCDLAGRSYYHLLERLLPVLVDANYELDIDDRRLTYDFQFDEITETSYSHVKWPSGHPLAGQGIEVREHQVNAVNSYLKNMQSVNILPTGAGKTLIAGILSEKVEKYGRSVTIVPSKDLVVQTEEDFVNLGLDVGVLYGDRKDLTKTHTICTWQSLDALIKKSKAGEAEITITEFLEDVICVIVDECFHPETLVLTKTGYKKICDIVPGEVVINYSESNKVFKEDTVVKVHKNLTNSASEKMYELAFDNGKILKVTGNHKFLTSNRGWVRADELTADDDIINYS